MRSLINQRTISPRIVLRFTILSILSSLFFVYRFLYPKQNPQCLNDAWHNFSGDLNKGLDQNGTDNIIIGIGQVLMDGWIVMLIIFW